LSNTKPFSSYAASRLRLNTLQGEKPELRPALELTVGKDGTVLIDCADFAYEAFRDDLEHEGMWSQRLGRTVTIVDGREFLVAVEESLVNSSYWHAEWLA
jgi:hypothetical protein